MRGRAMLFLAGCLAAGLGLTGCSTTTTGSPPSVAQAAPSVMPENQDLTVLVTRSGDVYVWGHDMAQDPIHRRIPGDEIRRVVAAPSGSGMLFLVDRWDGPEESPARLSSVPLLAWFQAIRETARKADFSSRIVWMDPRDGRTRTVFDSHRDRWGGEGVIESARRRAGIQDPGLPDNDIVDLFRDHTGAVHIATEDGSTYLLRMNGAALASMALVQPPSDRAVEVVKDTIQGREGSVVRWKTETH